MLLSIVPLSIILPCRLKTMCTLSLLPQSASDPQVSRKHFFLFRADQQSVKEGGRRKRRARTAREWMSEREDPWKTLWLLVQVKEPCVCFIQVSEKGERVKDADCSPFTVVWSSSLSLLKTHESLQHTCTYSTCPLPLADLCHNQQKSIVSICQHLQRVVKLLCERRAGYYTSFIFGKKWKCHYSSLPQAHVEYLDRLTIFFQFSFFDSINSDLKSNVCLIQTVF